MYLLRKGYVPMAGYVAERGGYGPPPLHFAKASFRSELRRETTLKPSLTYPLRCQATFALRRNEDVAPLARHELTFSQFYKYLATPPT